MDSRPKGEQALQQYTERVGRPAHGPGELP